MPTITVQNESGQVVSFDVTGPSDPKVAVLQQRIERGELKRVPAGTPSRPPTAPPAPYIDPIDAGRVDEHGDFLKSLHGGSFDPDSVQDSGGLPSGSQAHEVGHPTPETMAAAASKTVDGSTEGHADSDGAFDPNKHSVAEVQAHLESADEAERERVLEAERAGKARTTLLG